MDQLGVRVEVLRGPAYTGGELLEFDVVGRARGLLAQSHVHPTQVERLTVVSGAMKVVCGGRERLLGLGDSAEIPAGAPHRQLPAGEGEGRVRVLVRPAGETEAFLECMAQLCATGQINRFGFPRARAAARLVRDFSAAGHAKRPPLAVQRAFARLAPGGAEPYLFVDEWEVAAPPEAVFDAIADARSYPVWWRPVYLDVESDGPPAVGKESRQHFKGRLPYHLRTRSVITEIDPPRTIAADVDGDLRGRGVWTLTPTERGTHVRFDWQVRADRRLLRVLTPALRPLFRWNHNWAIARAMQGLEPYAQGAGAA